MTASLCPRCGAELADGMNFCRQCGGQVVVAPDASEKPTTILSQPVASPVTQRLDSRPTGAAYVAPVPSAFAGSPVSVGPTSEVPAVTARSGSMRSLIIVVVIILVLAGLGSVVGVMRSLLVSRSQRSTQTSKPLISKSLMYPGAQTLLNVTSEGGAGVLQLRTTDPIDKVADWYEANLKPTKTVRIGPTVVMKGDNATATIVSDGSNTNILIKQAP